MSTVVHTQVVRRGNLRAALRPRMSTQLESGDRIRDHVIVKRLGAGGFGEVYEVVHAVLGRSAALKILHRRHAMAADIRARFEREARLVNELRHHGIVDLFEWGETSDGRPFYVMELLEGHDLEAELVARGRLAPAEMIERIAPVLEALAVVHAAGVVHRDLKPSNVFVTTTGQVKLLDFGIAKPLAMPGMTRSHQQLGTPAYMAPEQITGGEVDARTDLYALAVVAFELVTGRLPFADESPRVMQHRHLYAGRERASRFVPELPAALDEVLIRAMAIDPAERYPDAAALLAALRASIATPASSGVRPSVAMYFEVPELGGHDAAETLFARLAPRLAEHGFVQAFACASSLLVVAEASPPARLVALAAELFSTASAAGLAIELAVHAGDVEWTVGVPTGGELLQLTWVTGRAGLHVSPALHKNSI